MASLLMRIIMIWMALLPILAPSPPTPIQDIPYQPRLEKLTSWGNAPTSLAGNREQLFLGQDTLLRQVHVDDNQNLVTDFEVDLANGRILAMHHTPSTLYILTVSTLIVFDVQTKAVLQTIRENGTEISTVNDWLIVTQPATRRLYQIQANGKLIFRHSISSSSDLQAFTISQDNIFIQAEDQHGLSWHQFDQDNVLIERGQLGALRNIDQLSDHDLWTYATRGSMVDIINMVNPAQPWVEGSYNPVHHVQDIAWQNGYVVIGDRDGLKLYDAINWRRQTPRYLNGQRGTQALHVLTVNQVLVVSRTNTIEFYDTNAWPSLEPVARFPVWDEPTALTYLPNSNRVLVGLGASGIAVFDFTQLTNPQLLGLIRFSAGVTDIAPNPHDGNTIHVLLDEGRLTTLQLNWNDLNASTILSDWPLAGYPTQLVIDANRDILAVASTHAATYFFKLNQVQPELLFSYAAENSMTQVAVNRYGEWYIVDGRKLLLLEILPDQHSAQILDEVRLANDNPGRLIETSQGILWGQGNQLQLLNPRTHHIEFLADYEAPMNYQAMLATPERVFLATNNPDLGVIVLNANNPRQPFEEAVISLPFVVEDWLYEDQYLLVSNSQAGIMQWQDDGSSLEWLYQVPHELTTLTDQPYRGALNRQGQYVYQTEQGLHYRQLPVHHDLQVIEDGWLVIDENYHLLRLSTAYEVVAENSEFRVEHFARNEAGFIWAMTSQQELVELDSQTLQLIEPALKLELDVAVTAIAVQNSNLFIGTTKGELLRLERPNQTMPTNPIDDLMTARLTDLGGDIEHIEFHGSDVLVITQSGGVWWLGTDQSDRFNVKSRYQPIGSAVQNVDFSPSNNWLAISLGSCGMAILDARQPEISLPLYAQWSAGVITDVMFISETEILTILNGVPTIYRFNPAGDEYRLNVPVLPYPPDKVPVGGPITELSWHMPAAECQNLQYEVWLNGERLTETTQPKLELTQPIYFDANWRVVAQSQDGQSVHGPTWQIYAQTQGWHQRPLRFQARLEIGEDNVSRNWPWYIFGGLGLMAMGLIVWIVVQRYINPFEDEED